MADDEVMEDACAMSLEEQFKHKNWKIRCEAYAAVAQRAEDRDEGVAAELGPLLAKAVGDVNAPAQEKALDAACALLKIVDEKWAARYAGGLMAALTSKCFNGRAGAVAKATEVSLLLIEVGAATEVVEGLLKGLKNRLAKVVLASTLALQQAVVAFGPNTVQCKAILAELPHLFDSKDGKVREAAKSFVVDLCLLLGLETMRELLLGKMRDAMRKSVEELVAEAEGRPRQTRFTRKEQREGAEKKGSTNGQGADDNSRTGAATQAEAAESQPAVVCDVYDLSEPVDIATNLSEDWFGRLGAQKWSERKAALTELKEWASVPRIKNGDFSELIRAVEKIQKFDSNIAVVAESINATSALGKGLRKHFKREAHTLIPYVIDKLKDKGVVILKSCQAALALWTKYCIDFTEISDEVIAGLNHKVPKVKVEVLRWIGAGTSEMNVIHFRKFNEDILPAVVVCASDSNADVRDASLHTVAAFALKAGGVDKIAKKVAPLDERQKKKLNEILNTDNDSSSPSISAKPKGDAKADRAVDNNSKDAKVEDRASSKKSVPKAQKKGERKKEASVRSKTTTAVSEPTAEEVEELVAEIFGEAVVQQLAGSNWKDKLQGMASIAEHIRNHRDTMTRQTVDYLVRFMVKSPGWSDRNVQVIGSMAETVSLLAEVPHFSSRQVYVSVGGMVEKIGDTKLKQKVGNALFAFTEASNLQFVLGQVRKALEKQKNPKVTAEVLTWTASALAEFGMSGLLTKDLIEWMKESITSGSAPVRSASVKVLGQLHRTVGPSLMDMMGDLKSSMKTTLAAEFAKNPVGEISKPVRSVRGSPAGNAQAAEGVPKTDISSKIHPALIANMGSSQWKERQAALQEVDQILLEAFSSIAPTVGGLFPALKARLSDTNKNLVATALTTIGKVAAAMGPPFESSKKSGFRILADSLYRTINDNKKVVRDACCSTLTIFADIMPIEKVLQPLLDSLSEGKFGPDGKTTSFGWMIDRKAGESSAMSDVLKSALVGMQDKSAEVRGASSSLIASIIKENEEKVLGIIRPLPLAQQTLVLPLIEANRPKEEEVAPERASTAPASACHAPEDTETSTTDAAEKVAEPPSPQRPGTSCGGGSVRTSKPKSTVRPATAKTPTSIKSALQTNTGPLFKHTEGHDARLRRLPKRANKGWDPEQQLRPEVYSELEKDLLPCIRDDLKGAMFSADFRKHCTAIDMILKVLAEEPNDVVVCRDLLFKWLAFRICDGNTASLVKSLELCTALLDVVKEKGIRLTTAEAILLLPCLVEKCGHNSDRVRCLYRACLRQWVSVYPVSLVCSALLDGIRMSKNNRTRVECVEEFGERFDRHGVESCDRNGKALNAIACLVSERDVALRSAALSTIAVVYKIHGENTWKMLGTLSEAQKSLIDDKFKWTKTSQESSQPKGSNATLRCENQTGTTTSLHNSEPEAVDAEMEDVSCDEPVKNSDVPEVPIDPKALKIAEWESAIRIVGSMDDEEAIGGMKIICRHLVDSPGTTSGSTYDDVTLRISQDANTLVEILARQTNRVFTTALSSGSGASTRSCKYVLNTFMHTFGSPAMAVEITEGVLRDLMTKLLLWLLNPSIPQLSEGTQLQKALNVLMLKILENSRRTVSFCALLHLIKPSVLQGIPDETRHRFADLVVKCLIKLTKALGASVDSINIERLLNSMHSFFSEMTIEEVKQKGAQEDKPLRMVKTILHEVCKLLGKRIRDYMSGIPRESDPPNIIHAYVDLNLNSINGVRTPGDKTPSSTPSKNMFSSPAARGKDVKIELAEIFRKIGDKRRTSQGLEELYIFQKKNPAVDISPHLSKTSPAFQSYISKGVAKAEEDINSRRKSSATPRSSSKLQQPSPSKLSNLSKSQDVGCNDAVGTANLDTLRERMRNIQAAMPKDSPQREVGKENASDIASLRERVARINGGV